VVQQAHERIDGCGYPNRLKGRQISEMAQILGVVDVFDALVSARPYRPRLLPHEAIKELLVAERAAFPREILKALIEQLSVYPVGTTVRLTTGEVATVERVNSRYPFRPVVQVDGAPVDGQSHPRHVDLSLTPLVAIIEALTPPAVGRVTFSDKLSVDDQRHGSVSTSNEFAALLESLDSIASAIREVVDSRMKMMQNTEASSPDVDSRSQVQTQITRDPMLHKELVGLFALEAREWLAQLQTALKKLDAGTERAARSKLHGVIRNGMTNLARSASTVQLSDIEGMAVALLPVLQDIDPAGSEQTLEWLPPIQEGLERIALAVSRLEGSNGEVGAGTESTDLAQLMRTEPVAESAPAPMAPALHPQEPVCVESSMPLLRALRELQRVRARSAQPSRDVLEAVIARAEQEVGPQQDRIAVEAVERILHELGKLDEDFLKEVHERVPIITEHIRQLRQQGARDFVTSSQLAPISVHVDALQELAKTVHAATITTFLQGVQSFLSAAAYRKVETLPQRFEAVEVRIQTLPPMAEQWVTLGRLEIASIEEILPR
jgi:hypothetical protein